MATPKQPACLAGSGSRHDRGATLIEAVSAIVVLGIAIPPLVTLFTEVAMQTEQNTHQEVCIAYADALMEEIVSKAFEDPDLAVGSFGTEEGTRAAYDDVDDYDGLSNSPPERLNGALLDDYAGFTRSVTVDNVTAAEPDPVTPAADGSTSLKRIQVTVSWSGGKGGELTLTTLRARLPLPSPLDEAASAATIAKQSGRVFRLNLVSVVAYDVEIESFDLSADASTPDGRQMKLSGKRIWRDTESLPTGVTALNRGTSAQRTVPAGTSPQLQFQFFSSPSGLITYTLVLFFTNGASSTMVFSIDL